MSASKADQQDMPNYVCKCTILDNVRIHSLWDTVYSGQSHLTPTKHSHFNHEVLVCTQGSFAIEPEQGTAISMSENDVCLIPRETIHGTHYCGEEPQKLALRFYIDELNADVPSFDFYNLLRTWFDIQKSPLRVHSPQITALVEQIHTELYHSQGNTGAVLELLLLQFFSAIFKMLIADSSPSAVGMLTNADNQNSRAYKIENFFAKRYAEQVVEEDLAYHLNLSLRQTTRDLQRLYGVTFREKLIQTRMQHAATLLLRTDMPANDIASAVGYTSTSGFFAMFRKHYGLSPLDYRRTRKDRMYI